MKHVILAGALISSSLAAPGFGQALAAPAAGKCAALKSEWNRIEMHLADNFAVGVTDNSAPRATVRAIEDNSQLLRASMLLDMMRDSKCPGPGSLPSPVKYLTQALECRTDVIKGVEKASSCDRATWKAGD